MKKFLFLPTLFFCFFAYSQTADTVVIKNMKNYKEGKINFLLTPSGKKIQVDMMPSAEWNTETDNKFSASIEPIDTLAVTRNEPLLAMRAAARRSYVDPALTTTQKEKIKENECINNRFAGLSRAKVKTSLVQANAHTYSNLYNFMRTLPDDDDMEFVIAALPQPWKERAIQEKKAVTVNNVYLIAYAREKDNDYHLILTNASKTIFFNVEISALPGSAAPGYTALKNVRQSFESFPGSLNCGRYTKLAQPILIKKIKGSIFFDSDHPAGQVGPEGYRPKTAWEIHPVSAIEF